MKKNKVFIKAEKISYEYPSIDELGDDWDEKKPANSVTPNTENITDEKAVDKVPVWALRKVDLQVEEGQFICILGSNGSGKSTLARHLNTLLTPTEGTVWIDGMDSSDENKIWDIRAMVGMVFQNPDNQIIGSQVDEDVAFGLENLGVSSEKIQSKVLEVLKDVGMTEYAKHSPNKLSGGQKQRVAVAGILAMQPKCIVLDESTAMLDPKGRKEIMDVVMKLNKEMGITIICITHFMEEVLNADRVFVMHDGKIALSGTPKEIFSYTEDIEKMGLKLPVICRIAEGLRKKGIRIPNDIITAEELKSFLSGMSGK